MSSIVLSFDQTKSSNGRFTMWFLVFNLAVDFENFSMFYLQQKLFGSFKSKSPEEEEGRVIVHDEVYVRGDIHKNLPSQFGDLPWFAALVSIAVKDVTTFSITTGGINMTLTTDLKLSPNLQTFDRYHEVEHDCTLSLANNDGKMIHLRFQLKETYNRWHRAIREALAEMIFTKSFQRGSDGGLIIRRIEIAIQKCNELVPQANCHMLRAKRIWNIKVELNQILSQLTKNPHGISREEVQEFLKRADIDRLLLRDTQLIMLKNLELKLFTKAQLQEIEEMRSAKNGGDKEETAEQGAKNGVRNNRLKRFQQPVQVQSPEVPKEYVISTYHPPAATAARHLQHEDCREHSAEGQSLEVTTRGLQDEELGKAQALDVRMVLIDEILTPSHIKSAISVMSYTPEEERLLLQQQQQNEEEEAMLEIEKASSTPLKESGFDERVATADRSADMTVEEVMQLLEDEHNALRLEEALSEHPAALLAGSPVKSSDSDTTAKEELSNSTVEEMLLRVESADPAHELTSTSGVAKIITPAKLESPAPAACKTPSSSAKFNCASEVAGLDEIIELLSEIANPTPKPTAVKLAASASSAAASPASINLLPATLDASSSSLLQCWSSDAAIAPFQSPVTVFSATTNHVPSIKEEDEREGERRLLVSSKHNHEKVKLPNIRVSPVAGSSKEHKQRSPENVPLSHPRSSAVRHAAKGRKIFKKPNEAKMRSLLQVNTMGSRNKEGLLHADKENAGAAGPLQKSNSEKKQTTIHAPLTPSSRSPLSPLRVSTIDNRRRSIAEGSVRKVAFDEEINSIADLKSPSSSCNLVTTSEQGPAVELPVEQEAGVENSADPADDISAELELPFEGEHPSMESVNSSDHSIKPLSFDAPKSFLVLSAAKAYSTQRMSVLDSPIVDANFATPYKPDQHSFDLDKSGSVVHDEAMPSTFSKLPRSSVQEELFPLSSSTRKRRQQQRPRRLVYNSTIKAAAGLRDGEGDEGSLVDHEFCEAESMMYDPRAKLLLTPSANSEEEEDCTSEELESSSDCQLSPGAALRKYVLGVAEEAVLASEPIEGPNDNRVKSSILDRALWLSVVLLSVLIYVLNGPPQLPAITGDHLLSLHTDVPHQWTSMVEEQLSYHNLLGWTAAVGGVERLDLPYLSLPSLLHRLPYLAPPSAAKNTDIDTIVRPAYLTEDRLSEDHQRALAAYLTGRKPSGVERKQQFMIVVNKSKRKLADFFRFTWKKVSTTVVSGFWSILRVFT